MQESHVYRRGVVLNGLFLIDKDDINTDRKIGFHYAIGRISMKYESFPQVNTTYSKDN